VLDPDGSQISQPESRTHEGIESARELISQAVLTGSQLRTHRVVQINR
jgi:hypothetical protein